MAHPLADQVVALFGLSPAFLLLTAVVGFFGFVVSATVAEMWDWWVISRTQVFIDEDDDGDI